MKKLEGILTIVGVLVIVGLPVFLMIADLATNSQVLSDGYIRVLSYDDSVKDTIDGDFQQTYSALDGTQTRDEVVYLYNAPEEEKSINEQIVIFNDDYIPLGVIKEEIYEPKVQVTEVIYNEPEIKEVPIINEQIIDGSEEIFGEDESELENEEVIELDEIVPEAVLMLPCEENFGDDISEEFGDEDIDNKNEESEEIIEFTEDVPEGLLEEEIVSPNSSRVILNVPEEFNIEELDEVEVDEDNEIIDDIVPEGLLLPTEESFGDEEIDEILEDNDEILVIDEEVPEGLLGLEDLEISQTDDEYNVHEVRYTSYVQDEFGNMVPTEVIFSY